jgi:hypothetical protein
MWQINIHATSLKYSIFAYSDAEQVQEFNPIVLHGKVMLACCLDAERQINSCCSKPNDNASSTHPAEPIRQLENF